MITPVTPSASSARSRGQLVDGPHVDLAAGAAHAAHQPRVSPGATGPSARRTLRLGSRAPPGTGGSPAGRASRRAPGLAAPWTGTDRGAPWGPTTRAARAARRPDRREARPVLARDQRAVEHPAVAQRLAAPAARIPGASDRRRTRCRRTRPPARCVEALLQRRAARAEPRPRSRAPAPAAVAPARAGRRTRSCRRRPRAPRRSSRTCCRGRSGRRPCVRPAQPAQR